MASPPKISPIPPKWLDSVIAMLEDGSPDQIFWSTTATTDWKDAKPNGSLDEGHEHLIRTLQKPGILGSQVVGMQDRLDRTYLDAWEFICSHPLGTPINLYAKIGLNHGRLHIWLVSLHIDRGERKGELEKAISTYLKKHSK